MRRLLPLFYALLLPAAASAQVAYPFTDFRPGQLIVSGEANANFAAIGDEALNRTGGVVAGHITVDPNVTIDGVDLSDYLTNSRVFAQANGAVGAPAFSRSGDTSTGWYEPSAGQIALALSGTQRLLLDGSTLTIYGNGVLNSTGRVPALSSTYLTSLDGSTLQIAESGVTNGSLLARNADNETITGLWQFSTSFALGATWNSAATTFTGLDVNPASTASAAASKLVDVRVAGSSKVTVDKAGKLTTATVAITGSACTGCVLIADANGVGQWVDLTNAVPSGMLAFFEAACPTGWTRRAAYDNLFIRGGATYDPVGGGSNAAHSHTIDPPATSTTTDGAHTHTVDFPSTATASAGTHNHGWGGSTTGSVSTAGAHTHTYSISVVTGASGGSVETQVGSPFAAPTHTHNVSAVLATASAGAHSHTISGQNTTSDGAHTHTVDLPVATSSSSGAHSHTLDVAGFTSGSTTALPAYVTAVVCKKD